MSPQQSPKSDRGKSQERFDALTTSLELPMTILAVVWIPCFLLPLLVNLSSPATEVLRGVDYVIWAAFAIEYLVKLAWAPNRWVFIKSHVLDLLIVVVPVFRPLRLARLARLSIVGRAALLLWNATKRLRAQFAKKGAHYVVGIVAGIILLTALFEWHVEAHAKGSSIHTYPQALWWAVVTVTTVGYGDFIPVTGAGRGIAVLLMIVGIGLLGTVTATIASFFVEKDSEIVQGQAAPLGPPSPAQEDPKAEDQEP
jgi:voltage-gated potassium channel